MGPSILRFLLFLGLEVLFVVAVFMATVIFGLFFMKYRALKDWYTTLYALLASMAGIGFMYFSMWLLTGKNYFGLFAVLAAVLVLISLVGELLLLMPGTGNVPYIGKLLWGIFEFEQSAPRINKALNYCAMLVFVVYPAYIGYGYFGSAFSSGDWPQHFLRYTLIVFIGVGWVTQVPKLLHLMVSKNVMEDTRSRFFIQQLASSIWILLLLSLFIWTIKAGGKTVPLLGDQFVFSDTVGYTMLIYLIAMVILPYLIGHYRAKHWMEFMDGKRGSFTDNVSRAFLSPNPAVIVDKLEEQAKAIADWLGELHQWKHMDLATRIAGSQDEASLIYRIALEDAKKRDPMFIHRDNLAELLCLVGEWKEALTKNVSDNEKHEMVKGGLAAVERLKTIQKSMEAGSKPWVIIAMSSLVGALFSPILSSVAKMLAIKLGFPQ